MLIPQQYHSAVIGKKGVNSQKISDKFHVNIQFQAKEGSSNQQQSQASSSNGGDSHNHSQEENETAGGSSASSVGNSPAKTNGNGVSADIVLISGFKDDCEKAREALLQLVPQHEDVPFPAKFHKELLADKAKILKDLQQDHNVQINVPKK